MGLCCSHDAWSGSYSAFNSFRKVICRAFGGSFPPHGINTFNEGMIFTKEPPLELKHDTIYFCDPRKAEDPDVPEGLYEFLAHSDCGGEMEPAMCIKVADDLEALLPKIEALTGTPWSGHIECAGGYGAATRKFIRGCREAASKNEPLLFR